MDLRWMSQGGTLIDGTGDLAITLSVTEEMETMVMTRLKAAIDGWKLYQIGADLDSFRGDPVNQNTELSIQRQVTAVLQKQFLQAGSFSVQTLAVGNVITVLVYLNKTLIASMDVTT
jgi:hypothetical protein